MGTVTIEHLTSRGRTLCKNNGITSLEQLTKYTRADLMKNNNCHKGTVRAIDRIMGLAGLKLKEGKTKWT